MILEMRSFSALPISTTFKDHLAARFSTISFVSNIAFISLYAHDGGASDCEETSHDHRSIDECPPFQGGR